MNRPLVISDCDEVLLHMVLPWSDWLREEHGIEFAFGGGDFTRSMRYLASGSAVAPEDMWRLLDTFFHTEMKRQYPIVGAMGAMAEIARHADVVVLTNLVDRHRDARAVQLAGHGLSAKVYTNQGPKGPALRRIVEEFQPSRVIFIDDIAQHHGSVAQLVPGAYRLHFCGEPRIAPHIRCAHASGEAHARIDEWAHALPWLLARINGDDDE